MQKTVFQIKRFQITKQQSVAKLNPIKLKIRLEYNSILNISYKKSKGTQKLSKQYWKNLR